MGDGKLCLEKRKIVSIKLFHKYLSEEYKIKDISSKIINPRLRRKLPNILTIEEVDNLLDIKLNTPFDYRNKAMLELMYSSGLRVSELINLELSDIDLNNNYVRCFGKGSKERVVYFDARTKIHLQNYLDSRNDNNPALFVSLKAPHERLKIGGIETRLREYGKQLGLHKVHPHKFRRTLATMAIDKGMPIEQLQQLLGHRKIDTTLQYAMVKQSNVKIAHRKYIG